MWRRIRALVIKEFLAVWRDKRSRFVLIGPPLFQLVVFSYAATFDIKDAAMAVLDLDGGPEARRLIDDFGSPAPSRSSGTCGRAARSNPSSMPRTLPW